MAKRSNGHNGASMPAPAAAATSTGNQASAISSHSQRNGSACNAGGRIADGLRPLKVPIDSVTLDPRNARAHPGPNIEAIKRSLKQYGQRKPIVVNGRTGIIEAGNGLWTAAKALGWDSIAAVKVDDDNDNATGYALMDNQSALLAEWDMPVLGDLLTELKAADFDLGLTGFDDKTLEELLGPEPSVDSIPGEMPEVFSVILNPEHRKLIHERMKVLEDQFQDEENPRSFALWTMASR